jgi:hypothetical protein
MKSKLLGAAALGLLVAACGTDPQERVTGGAAAGAATGAGVGALGGPVGALAGAAVGGGVGAVTGAVTEPSDVNLGRPVWENPETRMPGVTSRSGSSSGTASGGGSAGARQAQQALNSRGFDAGPADGIWGRQSQRATEDFQRANGLPVTGRLDSRTAQALNVSGGGGGTRTAQQDRDRAYMGGGTVNRPGGSGTQGTATGSPGGGMTGSGGGGTGAPPPNAMPPNATGSFGGPGNTPSGPGPGNTGGGQTQGGGGGTGSGSTP